MWGILGDNARILFADTIANINQRLAAAGGTDKMGVDAVAHAGIQCNHHPMAPIVDVLVKSGDKCATGLEVYCTWWVTTVLTILRRDHVLSAGTYSAASMEFDKTRFHSQSTEVMAVVEGDLDAHPAPPVAVAALKKARKVFAEAPGTRQMSGFGHFVYQLLESARFKLRTLHSISPPYCNGSAE